jgi:hypothetical protein
MSNAILIIFLIYQLIAFGLIAVLIKTSLKKKSLKKLYQYGCSNGSDKIRKPYLWNAKILIE